MRIKDLNGNSIEVTDINEAIQISEQFTKYKHKDKSFSDFDKRQNAYWLDMYEKLTATKERLTTSKTLKS